LDMGSVFDAKPTPSSRRPHVSIDQNLDESRRRCGATAVCRPCYALRFELGIEPSFARAALGPSKNKPSESAGPRWVRSVPHVLAKSIGESIRSCVRHGWHLCCLWRIVDLAENTSVTQSCESFTYRGLSPDD